MGAKNTGIGNMQGIGGNATALNRPATVQPTTYEPRSDTPSTAQPTGSKLPGQPASQYALPTTTPYGGPGEGASHFGGTGLGTPPPGALADKKAKWDFLKGLQSAGAPPVPASAGYPLPDQPAAAVVRGEPVPMVNLEQQNMQRQMLAQLMARLNSGSLFG